jgi:hypothetical protein
VASNAQRAEDRVIACLNEEMKRLSPFEYRAALDGIETHVSAAIDALDREEALESQAVDRWLDEADDDEEVADGC